MIINTNNIVKHRLEEALYILKEKHNDRPSHNKLKAIYNLEDTIRYLIIDDERIYDIVSFLKEQNGVGVSSGYIYNYFPYDDLADLLEKNKSRVNLIQQDGKLFYSYKSID